MDTQEILSLFEIAPVEIEEVSKTFKATKYRPNDVVFHEGAHADRFYFIKSGQALVTRKTSQGVEEPLGVLNERQCFGEIGIIENIERTATIKAIGSLELLEMERNEFLELLKKCPSFAAMVKDIGIRRLLHQVTMFKELDEQELKAIINIIVEKTCPTGEVIFKENDPPDALYIIVKGSVRVYRKTMYGKEVTLAYFGYGDFFGEQGLIESAPRSAAVVTSEECKFLIIPKDEFQSLLKKSAMISFNILKVLSHRMRETSKEMSQAKSVSFFKGMTIIARPDRCVSCRTCEIACAVAKSRTHKLYDAVFEKPLPVKRIRVRKDQSVSEPVIRPEHCIHCKDAPCLQICKFKAIKREVSSGTIDISETKCVGCGVCVRACPFDVISIIRTEGKKRMALKCTYCREHQAGPACVRSCPTNALVVALAPTAEFDSESI